MVGSWADEGLVDVRGSGGLQELDSGFDRKVSECTSSAKGIWCVNKMSARHEISFAPVA